MPPRGNDTFAAIISTTKLMAYNLFNNSNSLQNRYQSPVDKVHIQL